MYILFSMTEQLSQTRNWLHKHDRQTIAHLAPQAEQHRGGKCFRLTYGCFTSWRTSWRQLFQTDATTADSGLIPRAEEHRGERFALAKHWLCQNSPASSEEQFAFSCFLCLWPHFSGSFMSIIRFNANDVQCPEMPLHDSRLKENGMAFTVHSSSSQRMN